jgi:DNA-binding winged helix-turn-helix (wHTH) protein
MPQAIHWTGVAAFVFGPFRLFPRQRLLTEADKSIHLGSRAFDILVTLLERAGHLVSKEEFMDRVWPDTCVVPANLAVHISALRRALKDRHGGNRYVINIPGRGYRFVAPVMVEKDAAPAPGAVASFRERALRLQLVEPGATDKTVGRAQELPTRRLAMVGLHGIGTHCPLCGREIDPIA